MTVHTTSYSTEGCLLCQVLQGYLRFSFVVLSTIVRRTGALELRILSMQNVLKSLARKFKKKNPSHPRFLTKSPYKSKKMSIFFGLGDCRAI